MALSFPQLSISTRADDCYSILRQAILNLDLRPGSPLDEGEIARQLGVSKTPVREAISRLSGEGFVVSRPGSRRRVSELSLDTIREVYHLRIILESASIRDVTHALTDDELQYLDDLINTAESALENEMLTEFVEANEAFHELLIERSGNKTLVAIAHGLFDQAHRVRAALYRIERDEFGHELSNKGLEGHRSILDALISRDPTRAGELMGHEIQVFLDAIDTPEMQDAITALNWRSE